MKKNILFAISLVFTCHQVLAGPFSITNRVGTDAITEALFDSLETQVNQELPNVNGSTYAPGMANAAQAAIKGLGSDYSNDIDLIMVSANVGASISSKDQGVSDIISGKVDENKVEGAGLAATLTLGMNLGTFTKKKFGFFDLSKLDLFVNFMSYDRDNNKPGEAMGFDHKNFGLHARYHLIGGKSLLSSALLKWGGVFITTGLERSKLDLKLRTILKKSETNGGATAEFDGESIVGVESTITSIPIEVSTYVQLLYALTVYGGVGVDLNVGNAKVIGALNGNINVSGTATGSGVGSLDLSGKADVDKITARAFLGVQINIPVVKIYAQINKQLTNDALAANLGVKFVW